MTEKKVDKHRQIIYWKKCGKTSPFFNYWKKVDKCRQKSTWKRVDIFPQNLEKSGQLSPKILTKVDIFYHNLENSGQFTQKECYLVEK